MSEPAVPTRRRAVGLLPLALLVVVLGLGGWWAWQHRDGLAQAWHALTWPALLGALVCGAVGAASAVPIWRSVLAGLGSPLSLRAAGHIVLVGQLGKYLPGGVWPVVMQSRMAREEHVPVQRSGTASLLSLVVSVVTATVLGAVGLLLGGSAVLRDWWWVTLLALPLAALLHPAVLGALGRLAGRLLHRTIDLPGLPAGAVLRAAGWAVAGQLLLSAQYWLLVGSIGAVGPRWGDVLLLGGLFQLANAAGVLAFFLVAGAGPRELVLLAGTVPLIGQGPALLAALVSRGVLTVADLLLAGVGLALRPRRTAAAGGAPAVDAAVVDAAVGDAAVVDTAAGTGPGGDGPAVSPPTAPRA